jgi:equilibrative nucleoside transporter 1/2/3
VKYRNLQAEEDPKQLERLNNKELLLQNIDYALDMFLIYVLSLSIFPGFLSEDTGSHSLGAWYVCIHNYIISLVSGWSFLQISIRSIILSFYAMTN